MAERIELTFLGTGSAIPTRRRNHLAMLLKYKAENILIDCGEGTQRQFRKAGLNPCKIMRILITHWHGDHVFGLPGILNTLRLNGYNRKLEIYGPKGTKEWVRKYLDLVGKRGEDLDLKVSEIKSGIIFDELHVQPNRNLWDTLTTSTGARSISTGRPGSSTSAPLYASSACLYSCF